MMLSVKKCNKVIQSKKERLLKGPSRVATEKRVHFWNTYDVA